MAMVNPDIPLKEADLAVILRTFNVGRYLSGHESRVVNNIKNCQTETLGGHKYQCPECKEEHVLYNSCGDRHCPKCQSLARARWVESRVIELLPVQYFHVVFTLPFCLRILFLQNKRICYDILFKACHDTLKEVAANNLKAKVGGSSILHTWTQLEEYHPHVHIIIPGGGLSQDETKWISAKEDFLLPVRVLSKVFRGKLLKALELSYSKLTFNGSLEHIKSESDFKILLIDAAYNDSVVYCKSPFNGPEQVINYLGHYTHRVAISNNRIKGIAGDDVVFTYRDRKDENKIKEMRLPGLEFVERFLKHIVPRKYNRIRYFGIFGRRTKKKYLALCRKLLGEHNIETPEIKHPSSWTDLFKKMIGFDPTICQKCKKGKPIIIESYKSKIKTGRPWDSS